MLESLLIATFVGGAQGLVLWGAMRMEQRWLRRDVDWAHKRIDAIDLRCIAEIRRNVG